MPRAYNLIRTAPFYRREACSSGLRRLGYAVEEGTAGAGAPGDVLLIWNRYGPQHELASRFERAGGTVIVAENGYVGRGGSSPKFDVHPRGPRPEHYYALAVGGHNGQGRWPDGDGSRLEALGVALRPRIPGDHVLICPNRSFGIPGRMMPADWPQRAAERVRRETSRPIVIRPHPGNDAPKRPLEADLEGAHAVVIWSSNAGVHALLRGVPVFCDAPFWVCKPAAARGPVDAPEVPDPLPALRRMAWAQWTVSEIEAGDAFAHLLRAAGQG